MTCAIHRVGQASTWSVCNQLWTRHTPRILVKSHTSFLLNKIKHVTPAISCSYKLFHQGPALYKQKSKGVNTNPPSVKQTATKKFSAEIVQVFGQEDEDLGQMTKQEADHLAEEENLKLVLLEDMASGERHDIYKLMTGKQLVAEQMRQKEYRKHHRKKEQKTLKISSKISLHDLDIKVKHMVEWLKKGHDVQVSVKNAHIAKGLKVSLQFYL